MWCVSRTVKSQFSHGSMPKPQPKARQRVETLADRVAQARRKLGVALGRDVLPATLAEMVGVAPSTISRLEAGTGGASEDLLQKIAKELRVTPAYLRYGVVAEPGMQIPVNPPDTGKGE